MLSTSHEIVYILAIVVVILVVVVVVMAKFGNVSTVFTQINVRHNFYL